MVSQYCFVISRLGDLATVILHGYIIYLLVHELLSFPLVYSNIRIRNSVMTFNNVLILFTVLYNTWANFIQYGCPTNVCIVYVDQGVQQ